MWVGLVITTRSIPFLCSEEIQISERKFLCCENILSLMRNSYTKQPCW